MTAIKLQKRDNDFFVSYGHSDLGRVQPLVDLLRRTCGLKVWFDEAEGNAATRSSELLAGAIGNARAALFCVSEAWKRSSWCKDEYDVSLSERRMNSGFDIICLRLDDVDPPTWFNVAEIIDLRESTPPVIARLLRSLASDVPRRFDNAEDVYLAVPWSRPSPLVRETLEVMGSIGWRLIGDAPNLTYLGEQRIELIQRTTRGVVAVLPFDPSQPEGATSPYII
jgi:TIR domain